jgi:uncharacterized protein (TIGR03083 family)
LLGSQTPFGRSLGATARYRFDIPKVSLEESRRFFAGRSPDEVRRFWDEAVVTRHTQVGVSRFIASHSGFIDHLVHHQDMRRPTGHPRQIPEERLRRALQLATTEANPVFNPKRSVKDLSLHPTDLDGVFGDGPALSGPGEAVVMATAGRSAVLGELSGEGVDLLRSRLAA